MKIIVNNPERRGVYDVSQVKEEFVELLKICAQGRSALEIGSLYGGSAKALAESMPPGSRMVCIDLGYETLKPDWKTLPALLWRLESIVDRDIHLIIGDSMNREVIAEAEKLGPYDLVFIDGGHDHSNVESDWDNYGPMGKVVAFHDIQSCSAVRAFWDRVKGNYRHEEFIQGILAGMGVIWRS